MYSAIGLFNIVSINQAQNSNLIRTIKEAEKLDPDILCIQEIQRRNTADPIKVVALNNNREVRKANQMYECSASSIIMDQNTGIIVMNPDIKVMEYDLKERFTRIYAKVNIKDAGFPKTNTGEKEHRLIIYSVHVPPLIAEKKPFFTDDILGISQLNIDDQTSVIIAGDFNDYNDTKLDRNKPEDSEGFLLYRHWKQLFAPVLDVQGIVDTFRFLYPTKREYTRYDKRNDTWTRIDAILISENLLNDLEEVKHQIYDRSDHSFVFASLQKISKKEGIKADRATDQTPWKLHPHNMYDYHFCRETKNYAEMLLQTTEFSGVTFNLKSWTNFKIQLIRDAKERSIKLGYLNKKPQEQIQRLKMEIEEIENSIKRDEQRNPTERNDNESNPRMTQLQLKRERLWKMRKLVKDIWERRLRTTLSWRAIPDSLPMARKDRRIHLQNTGPGNTDDQLTIVTQFYRNLFTPTEIDDLDDLIQTFLTTYLPDTLKISETHQHRLREPFTPQEAKDALKRCMKGSAPGFDGLGFEYYIMMVDILADPFAEACSATLIDGDERPTETWPILKGSLIYKKGDSKNIKNYRPISILNTDLRWRENLMGHRMMEIADEFLSQEQMGFVKNRSLGDNVITVMLTIEQARRKEEVIAMISLDQEKAYDRVRWSWLFAVMKYMGFPDTWIKMIELTYQNPAVRFLVNKNFTDEITYLCGILQGGPISVLLYIISLQPLLSAFFEAKIGFEISFENLVASVSSVAYADDIILITTSISQHEEANKRIQEYEKVSNSVFSQEKRKVLIPIIENSNDGQNWADQIPGTRHPPQQDYQHLGCYLRLDGGVPEHLINKRLSTMRTTTYIFSLRKRTMKARIMLINTSILSMLWHGVQICPLPKEFHLQISKMITPFIFQTTKAPIAFELTCKPKELGGLGVIEPRIMLTTLAGRYVARAFSGQSTTALGFKLAFLQEIQRADGDFFRIFGGGKFHGVVQMTPFWQRIYTSIRTLTLSYQSNWKDYTDEEILTIPLHFPGILSKERIDQLAKRIRPDLFKLRFYLLRDVLTYDPSQSPPLRPLDTEEAKIRINKRIQVLAAEKIFNPNEQIWDLCWQRVILRAIAAFRALWPELLEELPKEFVERLQKIKEPTPDTVLAPLRNIHLDFDVRKIHDLIQWDKLTLANIPCANFSIKKARQNLTSKEVTIPNWTDQEIRIPEGNAQTLWKEAWKTLNWKSRPDDHFQAYWYLLHKRSPRPCNSRVEPSVEMDTPTRDWHDVFCSSCYRRDNIQHGYLECPDVLRIWEQSIKTLDDLIGRPSNIRREQGFNFHDILFAFPDIRRRLPKYLKARVLLWHSTIIHMIWEKRNRTILHLNPHNPKFDVDYRGWRETMYKSLWSTITQIHAVYKAKAVYKDFEKNWASDCKIWSLDQSLNLIFHEDMVHTAESMAESIEEDRQNESDEDWQEYLRRRGRHQQAAAVRTQVRR